VENFNIKPKAKMLSRFLKKEGHEIRHSESLDIMSLAYTGAKWETALSLGFQPIPGGFSFERFKEAIRYLSVEAQEIAIRVAMHKNEGVA